jgi:carboxymethylenebutenolidase
MDQKISDNITQSHEANISFEVAGKESCPAYIAGQGNKLGLVVIQEWWGMNKSITITADKFAKEGFVALIPDLYRGKVGKNHEEAGHLMQGLDMSAAVGDIDAAGTYLREKEGCSKVFVTGFCMGGALTIATLANSKNFDKGVPFYGVPDFSKVELKNISVPVLAHFGEKDQVKGFSDPEAAKKLEEEMKNAGVDFTLHLWEGGNHAFMNQDSTNYQPEIAEKAFEETVAFLKK